MAWRYQSVRSGCEGEFGHCAMSSRRLLVGGWCEIPGVINAHGAAHPWLRADGTDPVGKGWDAPEILAHMLLAHPSGRDHAAGR